MQLSSFRSVLFTGITALFLFCVTGARSWFGRASVKENAGCLIAITNIPGYTFTSEPVSPQIEEALLTSRILNGRFFRSAKKSDLRAENREFRIFLASWRAEDRAPLVVLGHTPDICWRGAGWEPVELGQPSTVSISIPQSEASASSEKTFQLRIFSSASNGTREIVVWCPLVSGRQLPASAPVRTPSNTLQNYIARARQFLRIVHHRVSVLGTKQFVRFSMPLTTDWPSALDELRAFAQLWLRERSQ